jgi:hypothetical protein
MMQVRRLRVSEDFFTTMGVPILRGDATPPRLQSWAAAGRSCWSRSIEADGMLGRDTDRLLTRFRDQPSDGAGIGDTRQSLDC